MVKNNAEAHNAKKHHGIPFSGSLGLQGLGAWLRHPYVRGKGPLFRAWGNSDVDDAKRLVDICLDAGVNLFDTADVYSDGASEIILGAAIKGRRDDVILSTKITLRAGEGPNDVLGGSVQSQLEGEELKTFKQGEIWWEPPGTAHVVPRNASKKNERSCSCFLLENKGRRLRAPMR
jgi:Aldo/keto reductase family